MPHRFLLHVDLDEFIAAVERLRRPELEGRPIVVGGDGDPTKRGVVSTASYEARAFGIHSAMPLRTAFKRNPHAVFLPVDGKAYDAASHEVMDALRSFGLPVEVLGWDEAFLAAETEDPRSLARQIQERVLEQTHLWCTVGIGDNRLQAKLASGFGKPRGVFELSSATWAETMGGLAVDELWGIGTKTARKLAAMGIRTVAELAAADDEVLAARFGPRTGPWLASLGRGEGSTRVHTEGWVPKGISREHTFQQNLTDPAEIVRELERIAREVAGDVASQARIARRVAIKVRFAPFVTMTRSVTLEAPTREPDAIAAGARRALERLELRRPVRLLGVRAELADPPGEPPQPREW